MFGGLSLLAGFPLTVRWLLSTSGIVLLPPVPTELWGGLLVTLVVASVGIAGSFPVGIALALGRRSRMPFARWASIGFIEFVRGVPLITVLFMSSVMLPLFLPAGVSFDKLLRALVGVALFAACLHGRDHPRRPAGHPARPVRGADRRSGSPTPSAWP